MVRNYPKLKSTNVYFLLALAMVAVSFLFTSCSKKGCKDSPTPEAITIPIKIQRLDQRFWSRDTTKASVSVWLAENRSFLDKYKKALPNMDEVVFSDYMLGMRKDKYLDTMRQEVASKLGELTDVEKSYAEAFAFYKYYYPKATLPSIQAFITGFSFDVSLVDSSLVMIGLESFLAGQGHYQPPMMPMYMLKRLKRSAIVPLTMMAISNTYNKRDILDATLTADIINWGKTYYFMEKMMPCEPDSNIIGFTPAQMDFVTANEKQVYGFFIQKKLFFITNHLEKRRYAEERPVVPEINEKCPGRIGRYLGWQIVRSYAKNSGKSLPEIMAEPNAQTIFNLAKYKP